MRKNVLDALFARPMQGILSAVLVERREPWYLSDLASRLERSPSTLQRPLAALVRAGILKRARQGNRAYFSADESCPIVPDLRSMLLKTVGLCDVLRDALQPLASSIQTAFVYGSVARGEQRSQSDVDLMVVGTITLADLTPVLTRAEGRLARPVNATVYPLVEFADKLAKKNHFLHSVLASDKLFVLGTPHELEDLARPWQSRAPRHKQAGAR